MHVGLIVYDSLDLTTGGFLYDRKLVDHLRAAGHEVTVEAIPWRSTARNLLDNVSPRVRSRVRSLATRADIVVQDELCHPSLAIANRILPRDVPIVAIVHHLRSHEPTHTRVTSLVERLYLTTVDAFVCTSQTTQNAVKSVLGRNHLPGIVATPGGDRLNPRITPEEITARAHESGPLRLVFIGSVVPRKGLDALIDGLAELPPDSWTLEVIGDTKTNLHYTARVTDLVHRHGLGDAVSFRGQIPDDALAATLANSHLLVVPSMYEGFGIVYLEAMGFGLPAIGTTDGGATEVIRDGDTGFLIPPQSPSRLAEAIRPLIRDRDQLAAMGQAARNHYESFPGWTETTNRIREYLEGLP